MPQLPVGGVLSSGRSHRGDTFRIFQRATKPPSIDKIGGAIVNTASTLGLVAIEGASAYTAAKHGVVGLTRTAALEFVQKNIRVNCVCPGFIRAAMAIITLAASFASRSEVARPIPEPPPVTNATFPCKSPGMVLTS
jgi:NAD(P)-dependent dehydrogenase (short-subunit alcohol dehydrogenase family)